MKRRLWIALGAVAVILLFVLASRPQPTLVETAVVSRGELAVVLPEEGETRVRDRFEVSAPVAGRILRIELEPGDPVIADETVLARFMPVAPTPLDSRASAEARASVEATRSALGRAEADEKRFRRELDFARAERERFSRLRADGVVSAEDLERAELAEQTAEEAARAAQFAVATTRAELQAARARLTGGISSGGEVLDLRSPVSGVVLRRLRESEAVVAPGDPLIEVGDPRSLEIIADYLSSDAVRVEPGDSAEISDWGGDRLRARVRRVEPSGFTKISALGVEEQRVNVILDLENDQEAAARLGDAFRVEVGIEIWREDDVLTVDNGALFRQGNAWATYRIVDGAAQLTEVLLGQRGSRASQVLDGLEEGDTVVLYPPSALEDGGAVEAQSG